MRLRISLQQHPRVSTFGSGPTRTQAQMTRFGGKSHIERRWGTTFINVAGLTKYHVNASAPENGVPRSWLLTFTDGSDRVTAQCYLHGNDYAPQGWYTKNDRVIKLSKPFRMPSVKAIGSAVNLRGESLSPELPFTKAW